MRRDDGVLLHVLAHVEAHDRALVVEQELRQRPRELGLADPGGPQEQEAPDRAVRIAEAGARAAHGVRDGFHRLLLPDDALSSSCSMWRSLCISPCIILVTGIPVHLEMIAGDVLIGDLLAEVAGPLLHLREHLPELLDLLFELGDRAVRDLRGSPEIALALRELRLVTEPLDLRLRLADLLDDLALALPLGLHPAGALFELGDLSLHVIEPRLARRIALLLQRLRLDLKLHEPPGDRVDLGRHAVDLHLDLRGGLVHEIDRLVGKKRSGTYRSLSVAAAISAASWMRIP